MKLTSFFICLIVFSSCGPSVQYVGKSLPQTSNVDVFFSPADVKKPYDIIGKVDGKAWPLTNFDKIQDKITEEAKKRGADGIIFTGMGEQVVGTTQSSNTDIGGDSNTKSTGDSDNGKTVSDSWSASVKTTTTTNNQTVKVMRADFIKYRE